MNRFLILYILFFYTLFLLGCTQKEDNSTKEIGEKLEFMDSPKKFILSDNHIVESNCKYKYVWYFDSSDCIDCKMRPFQRENAIAEMDSISGNSIEYYIFVDSSLQNDERVNYLLSKAGYKKMINWDYGGKIRSQIPYVDGLLLDSNNHILRIGDPITDAKAKRQIYSILNNTFVDESKYPTTEIEVEEVVHSLGVLNLNEVKNDTFLIKNIGKNLLVVFDSETSCGCTSLNYSHQPVKSGKDLKVNVSFTGTSQGHFRKKINMQLNTQPSNLELIIEGYVN